MYDCHERPSLRYTLLVVAWTFSNRATTICNSLVFFFFFFFFLLLLLLLLFFFFCVPQLYLWGSPSSSSSSASPSYISGVHLLLLRPELHFWVSPFFFFFLLPSPPTSLGFTFFFFFCVPQHCFLGSPSSSSAFPVVSLGFTFFFFCVPTYISRVHLLLLLRSQLYL